MRENLKGLDDLGVLEPEELNEIASRQGEKLARRVKTNQIRNVFSSITKIRNDYNRLNNKFEDSIKRALVMLKPKLAYAAGRNDEVRPFQELFDAAITGVINSKTPNKALENLFFLAEAVVAYHKYYGGREN